MLSSAPIVLLDQATGSLTACVCVDEGHCSRRSRIFGNRGHSRVRATRVRATQGSERLERHVRRCESLRYRFLISLNQDRIFPLLRAGNLFHTSKLGRTMHRTPNLYGSLYVLSMDLSLSNPGARRPWARPSSENSPAMGPRSIARLI